MEEPVPKTPSCEAADAPQAPDADAIVRLGASSDRMKLIVSSHIPARGAGRPMDAAGVQRIADQTGIVRPLDLEAVARVLAMLEAGEDVREVVIARGIKPKPSRDARVEPLADLSRPVFPGMLFGRLHPAELATPGQDLLGNEVRAPGRSEPAALVVPAEAGCVLGADWTIKATAYGMVEIQNGEMRVRPLITVSPDKLAVTGTIYGHDAMGARITASRIEAELTRLGVGEWADVGRILVALEEAWETPEPVEDALLAEGKAPVHGVDARLELLVTERSGVGSLDSQDRMNWRDRGFTPVVEAGQDIARLHPATAGIPGTDVYGQPIPAKAGKPLSYKPGKNAEALEEGSLFRALTSGVVLAGKGVIDVSDLLVIPGDVDLATGDIRTQKGSVEVRGTVRTGAAIEVPDSLLVGGAVEDATVIAGMDVTVSGGIVMTGDGSTELRAGGTVSAAFTQNARIIAGENVIVQRYIARSDITAGFQVRAGGFVKVTNSKGRIMGGVVISGQGIEVYEVGSPLGVATVLVLTQELDEAKDLVAEKHRLKDQNGQITKILLALTPEKAAQLTPEKRARIKDLLARREENSVAIQAIGRRLAALAQEAMDFMEAGRIIVRGMAHPGTVIKMGGTSLHLTQTLQASQFSWDRAKKGIKFGPI